jgi:hypothetical protein
MESIQEIHFQLFILYFKSKLQRLAEYNNNNQKICNFLKLVSDITEENTPTRIKKLSKRFLK